MTRPCIHETCRIVGAIVAAMIGAAAATAGEMRPDPAAPDGTAASITWNARSGQAVVANGRLEVIVERRRRPRVAAEGTQRSPPSAGMLGRRVRLPRKQDRAARRSAQIGLRA